MPSKEINLEVPRYGTKALVTQHTHMHIMHIMHTYMTYYIHTVFSFYFLICITGLANSVDKRLEIY